MDYYEELSEMLIYFEHLGVAFDGFGRVSRVLACPVKAEN